MDIRTNTDFKRLVKSEQEISTLQLQRVKKKLKLEGDKGIITNDYVILEEMGPLCQGPAYGSISGWDYKGDTFYRAIGPFITCVQFFGLMPMTGILGKDPTDLRFTWRSWRIVYSFLIVSILGIISFAAFYHFLRTDGSFSNFGNVVFYFNACLTNAVFLRLAPHWQRLSIAIAKEEVKRTRQPSKYRSLYIRFWFYSLIILFFALVEHLMSIASGIAEVYMCDKNLPMDYKFYHRSFAQIFSYTDYAVWKAIIMQFMNLVSTFYWAVKDLFIILISVGLAQRFDQLNESLNVTLGKHLPEQFWKITRCEYAHLARLVTEVDNSVTEIIMVSYANNVYSICLQLFNSLNSTHQENTTQIPCRKLADGGLSTSIYFVFSFSYLIIRFLAVSLSASRVYSSSRGPLKALYSVPYESYCTEVRRFIDHVTTDTVALTGLNFFHITRGLILSITGTVVTYELVLVQFNSPIPSVSANITLNDTCAGGVIPIINTTLGVKR